MAGDVELVVDPVLGVRAVKKTQEKLEDAGEKGGREFSKGFSKTANRGLNAFSVGAGVLGAQLFTRALDGIRNQIGGVVNAARKLEVFQTQFKTILGSAGAARKQLQDLQDFAARTPFQIDGLALATRQLLSFGVAQENVIPTLQQIGDIAASVGARIDDLTIPYGRLISTQKLTLIELDKFADRGVNLYGRLSEQTGISLKNIRDEISKGRVPFEEFTKALNSLTQEGGMFFKGMETQSKTLSGVISTLGDNFFNLQAQIGALFGPVLVKIVNELISSVGNMANFIKNNADSIIRDIATIASALNMFIIAPFEMVVNVVRAGFSAINAVVAGFVAAMGETGGLIARFLSSFDVMPEVQEKLKTFQESSGEVFDQVSLDTQEAFDRVTQFPVAAKIDELIMQLREKNPELVAELNAISTESEKSLKKTAKEIDKQSQRIAKSMNQALGNGVANGIQKITQSLIDGENIFKAFGNAVMTLMADMAIQMGKIFVATGIAQLALFSSPGASILAGAALIAAGTIAKSIFSGGGEASSVAGIGGAAGATGGIAETPGVTDVAETEPTEPGQNVTVNVQGSVIGSEREELARGIADILNEAFDTNGVTVRGAVSA